MPELRAALEAAGFTAVRTHLQSGNVVLDADADPPAVEAQVLDVLAHAFDLRVPVVMRTADELRRAVADDPLGDVATDGSRHFVAFCSVVPDPASLPVADPPEQIVERGRDLHLWCPAGARESRLMAAVGRLSSGPAVTVRNWNTVARLHAMLDEEPVRRAPDTE